VPQFEPRRIADTWRPLLNEIERRAGVRLTLTGAPDIPGFERDYLAGRFDFAYVNAYVMLRGAKRQGHLPLVRSRDGQLRGILVVRADSAIHDVRALQNQIVAFPAPNALAACLLPRALLKREFHVDVVPRYVRSHDSVYLNVVKGLAAAGGGVESSLAAQPQEVRAALRVLYTTPPLPPHPVAVHPRVPVEVRLSVQRAFLALADSDAGRVLLQGIAMPQPVVAHMDDYRGLAELGLDEFAQPEAPP